MKFLVLVFIFLSATAFGQQDQSDQQQIEARYQALEKQLTPFAGIYTGTISFDGGSTHEISLNLFSAFTLISNPNEFSISTVPTLIGTMNVCLSVNCFAKDPKDTTSADSSNVIRSCKFKEQSNVLACIVTQNTSECAGVSSANCESSTINLKWASNNHQKLLGTLNSRILGHVSLVKR